MKQTPAIQIVVSYVPTESDPQVGVLHAPILDLIRDAFLPSSVEMLMIFVWRIKKHSGTQAAIVVVQAPFPVAMIDPHPLKSIGKKPEPFVSNQAGRS